MGYKSQGIKCKATARNGQPCGRWAALGALVCAHHGGKAPQTIAKAAERRDTIQVSVLERMEALVPKAVLALEQILDNEEARPADRIAAASGILDRFVAKKVHAEVTDDREERNLDEEIAGLLPTQETG
jgi:hypothetical protein